MHHPLAHHKKRTLVVGLVFLLIDGGLISFFPPETIFIIIIFLALLMISLTYLITYATHSLWRGIAYSLLVISPLVMRLFAMKSLIIPVLICLPFGLLELVIYKRKHPKNSVPPANPPVV